MWLVKKSNYNLITFQNEIYDREIPLSIVTKTDSLIRLFMVYKPLEEQEIVNGNRIGYTVAEWGGSEYAEEGFR